MIRGHGYRKPPVGFTFGRICPSIATNVVPASNLGLRLLPLRNGTRPVVVTSRPQEPICFVSEKEGFIYLYELTFLISQSTQPLK